jgi:hypothetical protein
MANIPCKINEDNHKGNYSISISFDVYGTCNNGIVHECVQLLINSLVASFENWLNSCNAIQIKNVKWE